MPGLSGYWKNEGFKIDQIFESGGNVPVFGRFPYRSNTVGRAITSPFSIL